jgi:hypothetical protein
MPKTIDSKKEEMTRAESEISYAGDLLAREVSGKVKVPVAANLTLRVRVFA